MRLSREGGFSLDLQREAKDGARLCISQTPEGTLVSMTSACPRAHHSRGPWETPCSLYKPTSVSTQTTCVLTCTTKAHCQDAHKALSAPRDATPQSATAQALPLSAWCHLDSEPSGPCSFPSSSWRPDRHDRSGTLDGLMMTPREQGPGISAPTEHPSYPE